MLCFDFFDAGVKTSDVLNLICKVKTQYSSYISTFLTVSCRFASDTTGCAIVSLSNQLSHWSDLTFDVDELSTGISKDVHGQVRFSCHAVDETAISCDYFQL